MKKIIMMLTLAMILVSAAGCQAFKKKEEETEVIEVIDETVEEPVKFHYSLSVDKGNGIREDFEIDFEKDMLTDILKMLADSHVLKYDIKGNEVLSLQGIENKDYSRWAVYLNGSPFEGDLEKLALKENDKISFVYETSDPEPEPGLLGGWIVNENFVQDLSGDERDAFAKACDEITGMNYIPLRVIAIQTLSGVNYAYLAQRKTISEIPESDFYVMVIYKDSDGYCELKALNKIEIPDMMTMDNSDPVFLKSWMIIRPGDKTKFSNTAAQKSFEKATKDLDGLDIYPVELLASQIVAGTNYIGLCFGETVALDPVADLYIAEWYEDLQGNCSLTRLENLNMQYYVAGE